MSQVKKIAWVTGGGSGIGLGAVQALAVSGWTVILSGRGLSSCQTPPSLCPTLRSPPWTLPMPLTSIRWRRTSWRGMAALICWSIQPASIR